MGYGNTKSQIRKAIASGSFQKKDTTIQDSLMGGAQLIASGMLKRAEEERAEERRKKAAAAAEAKRLAAEQRKKEQEAEEVRRTAVAIANRYGVAPSNKEGMNYITEQVYAFGDSAAALIESDFQSNRFKVVTKDDMRPVQGPDVPSDFQTSVTSGTDETISAFSDGRPITAGDLPAIAANEDNPQPERDSAAQMAEILAPVSEEPAVKVGEYQGIMVDPMGKPPVEFDVSRLETLDSIDLYLGELAANNQQLTEQQQAVLDDRIEKLTAQKGQAKAQTALEFRRNLVGKGKDELSAIMNSPDYTTEEKASAEAALSALPGEEFDIAKYDDVDDATIQTIIDTDGTDPKKVTALSALLANRKTAGPKVDTQSADYQITYLGEDGKPQTTIAKLAEDGTTFVDLNNPGQVVRPMDGTSVLNLDRNADLYDDVIKINQSLVRPLKEQRVAMATTLRSAKRLDDLVNPAKGGDPEILTIVGGTLPTVLTRIGLETNALVQLFNESQNEQAVINAIDERFSQYITDTKLAGQARNAALFQAEKIKLAFSFAASSLGQSNTGLSNKDFDNSLKIIDQGSSYGTFSSNLRSQVSAVVSKTSGMIQDFREDASIRLLEPLDPSGQIFTGYTQSAEEYANSRGLGEAYTWSQSSVDEAKNDDGEIPVIETKEQRDALEPGTKYIGPDGQVRTKK